MLFQESNESLRFGGRSMLSCLSSPPRFVALTLDYSAEGNPTTARPSLVLRMIDDFFGKELVAKFLRSE